jgi:hypothetical protein
MRARRTLWFIISAVASTIGCADSVAPQDFVGEYVLTRVAGDPLPTLIFDQPGASPSVVADTLRLRADGTGSRMRLVLFPGISAVVGVRATTGSGVDTTIVKLTSVAATNLTFEVVGNALAITYVCPINADCAPPPHAVALRTPVGLTVTREGTARVPEEFVLVRR